MVKSSLKNIISVMIVCIIALANFTGLYVTADAAKTYSIKITYIGQPTETTGVRADYALKVKFDIKGYAGTKLRLQICNSDGVEVYTKLSKEIETDDYWYAFYYNGKDKNGSVLKDGNYYVSYWIEGSQHDTETTKYYKLDFKGNGTTTTKSYKCTYMGEPNNPESKFYDYAMLVKVKTTGYKGKNLIINLYAPDGSFACTSTFKVGSDDYTCNMYYDGTDPDEIYTGDGTYSVVVWIDGEATSKSWYQYVTLKKVQYAVMS
jgi:flagellar hook assembly protein FlgD